MTSLGAGSISSLPYAPFKQSSSPKLYKSRTKQQPTGTSPDVSTQNKPSHQTPTAGTKQTMSSREPVVPDVVTEPTTIRLMLTTRDRLIRPALLKLRPNAKGNIVMCHPAAYSKEFFEPFEKEIFAHYNCLSFDFRRHGELSDEQYTTLGKKEVYEVEAALKLLDKHDITCGLPTYGFGISMGAATLIEAESQLKQFDGLILQAPYDSIRQQAGRSFRIFSIPLLDYLVLSPPTRYYAKKKFRIKLYKVRPASSIKKIETPIFLIHAKDDPTINIKAFHRLKRAGKSIVKTWTPETGKHTALYKTWPKLYAKHCVDFLDSVGSGTGRLV